VIIPPPAPAPSIVFAPAPAIISAPAPVFFFAPAPAIISAPAPIIEEKKIEKLETETLTVKVFIAPSPIAVTSSSPIDSTTEKKEFKEIELSADPAVDKILMKIAVPKLPQFKGVGPFTFALGLTEQASSKTIKDPQLTIGVKVFSQTPGVCSVSVKFNKSTSKYTISVTGISNGQCKITALDKGNSAKFPTALEIKQTITGVLIKKTVNAKAKKPIPAPKAGTTKVTYKPTQR
jgi:hypothetical protein